MLYKTVIQNFLLYQGCQIQLGPWAGFKPRHKDCHMGSGRGRSSAGSSRLLQGTRVAHGLEGVTEAVQGVAGI